MEKVILLILLLLVNNVHAEVYRWVDSSGKVHFGDYAPNNAKNAVNINVRTAAPTATPEPAVPPQVLIYTTTWCPICRKAKAYFAENNIEYIEYDVENDEKGKADFASMEGTGVPIILIGEQRMNGFSSIRFQSLFDRL